MFTMEFGREAFVFPTVKLGKGCGVFMFHEKWQLAGRRFFL